MKEIKKEGGDGKEMMNPTNKRWQVLSDIIINSFGGEQHSTVVYSLFFFSLSLQRNVYLGVCYIDLDLSSSGWYCEYSNIYALPRFEYHAQNLHVIW